MNAAAQRDCYKEYHHLAYHPEVTRVYSNFTNRSGKYWWGDRDEGVIFVGLQYFLQECLIDEWNDTFFSVDKDTACIRHKKLMESILGHEVDVSYLERLHDLGYLPIEVKALQEGTLVPYQVPTFTIVNTIDGFQWLPNMLETVFSCENWPIQTSATTSFNYFRHFKEYFEKTGGPMEMLPFMGHDFSFRGMFGRQAAMMSGFGHLAAGFAGTDTIPAVLFAEKFYGADYENELVGASVDATEHSVTCSWIEEGEYEFFKHLMTEVTPYGILSLVSDTWDFWEVVTKTLPSLKDVIMNRKGKVVVRPDSGDPVKILTGYSKGEFYRKNDNYYDIETDRELQDCEVKGLIECLWDEFGGRVTEKGYRLLDDHVGAIYGDAITLDRQIAICERLMEKGFVPMVVLGIGSYSFQCVTRDTHGSAMKATAVYRNGEWKEIHKDPKTDPGKKSHRGLLRVDEVDGEIVCFDQQTPEQEAGGLLVPVFRDGKILRKTTLSEIRERVASYL